MRQKITGSFVMELRQIRNTPKRRSTKIKKPRSGGTQYGAEFGKFWSDHVGQRAIIIASPLALRCGALATRPHKIFWRMAEPM
jgi:hypothetical protein